jgi:hypothetical protein
MSSKKGERGRDGDGMGKDWVGGGVRGEGELFLASVGSRSGGTLEKVCVAPRGW